MTENTGNRSSSQQQIIDRAAASSDFRAKLLQSPHDTIQEEFGIPLPPNVRIRVVEEQPGEVVLVLPARSVQSGSALSDADLDVASGGASGGDSMMSACLCW
jgi:hypothetical protein